MSKLTVRITNETVWPTRMLRPFIVRVARHEFDGSTPARRPRELHVKITYAHDHGYCSGSAYLRSSRSTVSVPNPTTIRDGTTGRLRRRRDTDPPCAFPVHDFVHVLAHEFAHNIGMRHAAMFGVYRARDRETVERAFPWVATLPVPVLLKKAKPDVQTKRAAKLDAARAAVARWTRKRKLAETKLKAWTRKVRALERALAPSSELAAARKPPTAELTSEPTCGNITVEGGS